jgi:hypothetical protein
MPHQVALTIHAAVPASGVTAARAVLDRMHAEGAAHNGVLPFAELAGVHFARVFGLEPTTDLAGDPIPAALFYMADVDAPVHRHLRALVTEHGAGCDALFGSCDGYPAEPTPGLRMAWLLPRMVQPAATYVHRVGRSVGQVHDEHRLRNSLETWLDLPADMPRDLTAVEAHDRVRSFVLRRDDLRWSARRPRGPGFGYQLRDLGHLLGLPLVVLLCLPLLVPAAVVLLVLIRLRERRDVAEHEPATDEKIAALEATEDHVAQNPFTAIGFVKPGRLRALTMRAVLLGLDWFTRHVYRVDNLAGVRTIHFARWVPIDDGRRLIFASSYDGSLESYMDDFIDRLAWGLNAVFSNGAGYPSTRWLVLDGATDEIAFKNYLRNHQIVTPVWYTAYGNLPARNVDDNTEIRLGMDRTMDEPSADEWLARL